MRIAMIGAGYVGLVSGACFSEFGTDVTCVDRDESRIDQLRNGLMPLFEPGLGELITSNMEAGRLRFSTDLEQAVRVADAVFIAVGTPGMEGDGKVDLSGVRSAAEQIAHALNGYTVIVTKSTVPVGSGREVANCIRRICPQADFDVASNPEFLREGSAIENFLRPDRVVIGTESSRARDILSQIYRPLHQQETPVLYMTMESAELTKYAANAFLATKVAFINEIANLSERLGADIQDVARAIGLDQRIGSRFLRAGPGYGGSCFPKDTVAMVEMAQASGTEARIAGAVVEVNERRMAEMTDRIVAACGGSVTGLTIAVLGLTFKPNTDDIRCSPSLVIVPDLMERGARVRAYDPRGSAQAMRHLDGVEFCSSVQETLPEADALVLVTEWNEFRQLDLGWVKGLMRRPLIIDLRNVYRREEMQAAGFDYFSIGRAPVLSGEVS